MINSLVVYVAYGIVAAVVLAFVLLAHRDVARLLGKGPRLGRGTGRVWAIARTSMLEAWAARVWAIVPLWLAISLALGAMIRPYEEIERAAVTMKVLLWGQEFMVLLAVGVLACFSLPRERERRTVITTGAKPISRLELYLGKMVGFTAVAGLLLAVMGATSWVYLQVQDYQVRQRLARQYDEQMKDWEEGKGGAQRPAESLKLAVEAGLLKAHNYVAPLGMQVAGRVDPPAASGDLPVRWMKGGSEQRVILRFATPWADPRRNWPFLRVQFVAMPAEQGQPLPETIDVQVMMARVMAPMQGAMIDETISLRQAEEAPGYYYINWRPESGHESLFSVSLGAGQELDNGPMQVAVRCLTPGVYLRVEEARQPEQSNVLIGNLDTAKGPEAIGPSVPPRMIGFEKRDKQQIEGGDAERPELAEVMSWRFKASDLRNVPVHEDPATKARTFNLSLYLDLDKSQNNPLPTQALVVAYNEFTQTARHPVWIDSIQEKRETRVTLPASLLSKYDSDLYIELRSLTPGHWIGGDAKAARLEQPASSFLLNLAKSELVIFLEVALLVVIGVAASVTLGGWVSILVTAVAYLLGNIMAFVQQLLDVGTSGLISAADQKILEGNLFYQLWTGLYQVTIRIVYMFMHMVPDFRIYESTTYLAEFRNMPWMVLGTMVLWTALYAVPFLALAYLMFRKQELA